MQEGTGTAPAPEARDVAAWSEPPDRSLAEATQLMLAYELELEAKGYTTPLARAAVERARQMALYRVKSVRPELRTMAFLDTLQAELRSVEDWCKAEQSIGERR